MNQYKKPFKTILLGVIASLLLWPVLSLPHWVRVVNAIQVYLYGYPLVSMGVSKDVMTATEVLQIPVEKRKIGSGPVNQFSHARAFPDHNFRDVVAPNADTLYSIAWLDLSDGPMVLHLPEMKGRWVFMGVLDAWTDQYESLGTRKYGGGPRDYLITGPGWVGEVPAAMVHVTSPTELNWIVGRTLTKNEADFGHVHAFQDQYLLTPYKGGAAKSKAASIKPSLEKVDSVTAPLKQVAAMDAEAFYTKLAGLMVDNPPPDIDAAMVRKLANFGIQADTSFKWKALDADAQDALQEGLEYSRGLLDAFSPGSQGNLKLSPMKLSLINFIATRIRQSALNPVNGWNMPMNLGHYGTNYPLRAIVALIGLGANTAEDAVYPFTSVDADTKPLNGSNRYRLHFERDKIPPVNAFWSLTLYDMDGFFTGNALNRYALGDRNPLKFNADGSLDLWIQSDAPAEQANWLPAPRGPFKLYLRIYNPKPEVLKGQWIPPAVQAIP